MPNWGSVAGVEARLTFADAFSVSTDPTLAQVTAWLDEAEAILRGTLAAQGLTTSYTGGSDGALILGKWVNDYGEGRVRQAWASVKGNGELDGRALLEEFEANLERIRMGRVVLGGELIGGPVAESQLGPQSYFTDNTDGLSIANGDFDPVITSREVF